MERSDLRIVFMGTPDFAVPSLKALVEAGYEIAGVVTQPDRPKGRGKKVLPSPVKEAAINMGLSVLQPKKIGLPEFVDYLRILSPEVIVVVAFGQILPVDVLEIPSHGCINVHASLLPKYRGAAPIHWAIINGEQETGITTMFMNKGLDTGDVILQESMIIKEEDTAGTVCNCLAKLGARLLLRTLLLLKEGRATRIPQDERLATYAPPLKSDDELIRWNIPAKAIKNLVRGLNPWPGAHTFLKGRLLKIWQVKKIEEPASCGLKVLPKLPGEILVNELDEDLIVKTGEGFVSLEELQLEGSQRMNVRDFLRGARIKSGLILGQ